MKKTIRFQMVLAALVFVACAASFAQSSGEATYKANCQSCHGAAGVPSPSIGKMMGIKAVSDPDIRKLSSEEMFTSVKNGKNKMKPFSGKLTDQQIKDSLSYYRSLNK